MSSSKKINVSDSLHQQIEKESKRLKLTQKEYVASTVSFFHSRQIDPRTYQPEENKQIIQQAIDRIFSYLVYQEKHLLKDLYLETAKARILSELSVNHLISLMTEDEASLRQIQQQDQQYLTERLNQITDHQENTKP